MRLMKCMKIRKKWCPKLQYLTIKQLKKYYISAEFTKIITRIIFHAELNDVIHFFVF